MDYTQSYGPGTTVGGAVLVTSSNINISSSQMHLTDNQAKVGGSQGN